MTRFLSEALQSPHLEFRRSIAGLESSSGHLKHDIVISTTVEREARAKVEELGLDPHDTTAQELYHAINARVLSDDVKLTRALRYQAALHINAEADITDGIIHELNNLPVSHHAFAVKNAVLKVMLKKSLPKRAMKALGYRSLESMLKRETPVMVLAAAELTESARWRKTFLDGYKKLSAADFEERRLIITRPSKTAKWDKLATSIVEERKHNILSLAECGALIVLPLPEHAPDGAVTASLGLSLHQLNTLRAASTFLKIAQVRSDFGKQVMAVARDEAELESAMLDSNVPWSLVQKYYARIIEGIATADEMFSPHINAEDLTWNSIEKHLSHIDPNMQFWSGSAHLGLTEDRQPVSFNVVDAAVNAVNKRPFATRSWQHFQTALWSELMLKYMNHDKINQTLALQEAN